MVDAKLIKELRAQTGAGLADCKKALLESGSKLPAAREWLRARGAELADKKSARVTQEGAICISANEQQAAMVEILAETDFVANNSVFRKFAQQVADALLTAGPDGSSEPAGLSINGSSVEQLRAEATLQTGENVQVGRWAFVRRERELHHYLHHNAKVGVIADVSCGDNPELGKQLCMHIAALKPSGLSAEDLDQQLLDRQRQAFVAAAGKSGKPPEVQQRIVSGKMSKFVAEHALLGQAYAWEEGVTVGEYLKQRGAQIGSFALLSIGS